MLQFHQCARGYVENVTTRIYANTEINWKEDDKKHTHIRRKDNRKLVLFSVVVLVGWRKKNCSARGNWNQAKSTKIMLINLSWHSMCRSFWKEHGKRNKRVAIRISLSLYIQKLEMESEKSSIRQMIRYTFQMYQNSNLEFPVMFKHTNKHFFFRYNCNMISYLSSDEWKVSGRCHRQMRKFWRENVFHKLLSDRDYSAVGIN